MMRNLIIVCNLEKEKILLFVLLKEELLLGEEKNTKSKVTSQGILYLSQTNQQNEKKRKCFRVFFSCHFDSSRLSQTKDSMNHCCSLLNSHTG
jgi:hypothetical protein